MALSTAHFVVLVLEEVRHKNTRNRVEISFSCPAVQGNQDLLMKIED